MPMVLTDVKAVVSFMRTQGVSSFRLDELEVSFSAGGVTPPKLMGTDALPIDASKTPEQQKLEDDDLLFHSSPF